ncbi:PaREP1 family protein [Sulfolobus tengchongensis]|uniref:PaREP1 family protein n=1 Tax=Sulfolobus tengchongensis TaxID=207809 RepID=A0AAX4L254_9CREN
MERDLYQVNEDYLYARILESLADSLLAIELFERGFTRNSAGKAFSAVKSLISALIVKHQDKILEVADEKEKDWLVKKAHTVPTHSMKALSNYLERIGIDIDWMVDKALNLHDYQYNGFERDFSFYRSKDDVKKDIIKIVSKIPEVILKYFKTDGEISKLVEEIKSKVEKFSKSL